MTASLIDTTARLMARACDRAIPIRHTSSISTDPEITFGIAPIRMVAEEQVQAIAFGPIDGKPSVAVRWNPLSRDPGELGIFAAALDDYIAGSLATSKLPRIWVPHALALEVLDMLGHRMHRNRNATPDLQRMGALCRALAVAYEFPGQQVVAVAGSLLKSHVVTGQAPIEDGHVRTVVAWVQPPQGVDPREEAARRSLVPANAMLQRHIDDEVERLRKIGKGEGAAATDARRAIKDLLRKEALREWEILIEARQAFLSLGLAEVDELDDLVTASLDRFGWMVTNGPGVPSRPVSRRRRLLTIEAAASRVEDLDARSDGRTRERLRRTGRVIVATVEQVIQPEKRRRPLSLLIRADQAVQRVRKGTMLKTEDNAIKGRVRSITFDTPTGSRLLELALEKGRQKSVHYTIGYCEDWYATDFYDNAFRRNQISKAIDEAHSPVIFEAPTQSVVHRRARSSTLIDAAAQLRKS